LQEIDDMQLLDHAGLTAKGVVPTSREQRWRLVKAGRFPKPIKIGKRSVWVEAEIDKWIAERIAERDAAGKAA
jgi:predicted DNA-binding transcriptional regulator AlpA